MQLLLHITLHLTCWPLTWQEKRRGYPSQVQVMVMQKEYHYCPVCESPYPLVDFKWENTVWCERCEQVYKFDGGRLLAHNKDGLIGKRVLMRGKHPHSGKTGTVRKYGSTIFGRRPIVDLDDGLTCFIMRPYEAEIVSA